MVRREKTISFRFILDFTKLKFKLKVSTVTKKDRTRSKLVLHLLPLTSTNRDFKKKSLNI